MGFFDWLSPKGDPRIEALLAKAQNGNVEAQIQLAHVYLEKKKLRDAAKWFESAAKNGHPDGQFHLAAILEAGSCGFRRDLPAALRWHTLAAQQGHDRSQFRLGVMYRCGYGTAPDIVEAFKWLRLAAQRGNPYAVHNTLMSKLQYPSQWMTNWTDSGETPKLEMLKLNPILERYI